MVGAEHANPGAELGSTKGDHVLPDMGSNDFAMLRVGVRQDVLDQVIAILIASNVDEGDPGAIMPALADTVKISSEKFGSTNLEALLDDLGSKLIHAVLGSVADDVINGPAPVGRGSMLANVLNAPVAKLAVGDDVDVGEDLLDTRTLRVTGG